MVLTVIRRSIFLAVALLITIGIQTPLSAQDPPESPSPGIEDSARERFEGYLFLDADCRPLPFQTDEAIEAYLATASIVSSKRIPVGVTDPKKLLLVGQGLQINAVFKSIDHEERNVRDTTAGKKKFYLTWRDWYGFDIAAYRLDRLLGLNRVPPVIERSINRQTGSVQIWLEGVITDTMRRDEGHQPPSIARYNQQKEIMHVFDNLVANRDSNLGNTLIDCNWRLWFIDCSRCFGSSTDLLYPQAITHCERGLWEALQNLDRTEAAKSLTPYLSAKGIDALFARRDKIVDHINGLIEDWGEIHILFDAVPVGETATWQPTVQDVTPPG